MNGFAITIFMACLFAIPVVHAADEDDHSAHHVDAEQSPADPMQDDMAANMHMQRMQERINNMQELMSRMHSTSDSHEREKLMHEHMMSMREGMKSMRGMMSMNGMMGKGGMMEQIIEREAMEQQMEGR